MSKLELIELCVLGVCALVLFVFYLIKAIKNKWVSNILNTINQAIKEVDNSGPPGPESNTISYSIKGYRGNKDYKEHLERLYQGLTNVMYPPEEEETEIEVIE